MPAMCCLAAAPMKNTAIRSTSVSRPQKNMGCKCMCGKSIGTCPEHHQRLCRRSTISSVIRCRSMGKRMIGSVRPIPITSNWNSTACWKSLVSMTSMDCTSITFGIPTVINATATDVASAFKLSQASKWTTGRKIATQVRCAKNMPPGAAIRSHTWLRRSMTRRNDCVRRLKSQRLSLAPIRVAGRRSHKTGFNGCRPGTSISSARWTTHKTIRPFRNWSQINCNWSAAAYRSTRA